MLNALLETFLAFTIISFIQKLIKGGEVGIRAGGWKIFQKLTSGGGTIIRYSRVQQLLVNLFSSINHTNLDLSLNFDMLSPFLQVALNTHLVLIFCLLCVVSTAVYFTFITTKYVLRTPILDELGFFDAKIIPILTYRKAVNTRTAANAFMVNHVWIPYYETRFVCKLFFGGGGEGYTI